MAIQNINNNTLKRKRIRISKKGSFILLGVCSLLIIVLGSYFYMTTKPQIETNILIPCQQENKDLTALEIKMKTLQEELNKENLTPETKNNLEQIMKKQQEKQTNLKNFITFQTYMNHLETDIQECEKELKENEVKKETSLAKKHQLAEKKLTKEKEFLALKEKQKLFTEKDELQNDILKDLKEKLKKPNLTPADKTPLETKQTEIEKRIIEINQEITNLITKIELKNKIETLTEDI